MISVPSSAMETKGVAKITRPSRPAMSVWDSNFIKLLESHKGIAKEQFINLETCLLAPLWEANKSRMDQARLAKLIYTIIPLVRHRLGCAECLGNTLMQLIAASGNGNLIDEILKIHEQSGRTDIDLVNICGLDGATPMHFAVGNGVRNDNIPAEKGDLGMVTILLRHGANLSIRDNEYKLTPFGHALLSRREEGQGIADYLSCLPIVKSDNSVFEYVKADLDRYLPTPGMYPALEKFCKGSGSINGYAILYKRLTGKEYDGILPEEDVD